MKKTLSLFLAAALAFLLAGCTGGSVDEVTTITVPPVAHKAPPSQEPTAAPTPTPTPEPTQEPIPDIFPRSFSFCSGAGGWSTELEVAADGSFTGSFHDSDMGDGGEGYPGGTVYFCNFSGQFSAPIKVNDYTYSMRLERLDVAEAEEEIADEIRWVPSGAYGIEGGDEFLVYLPGAPMKELPEYFLNWICAPNGWDRDGSLPNYGLFNVETQEGWYGGN